MGIFVALSLFVVAMGYTVYLTMQNDYELVDEHYYQRELGYDVTWWSPVYQRFRIVEDTSDL